MGKVFEIGISKNRGGKVGNINVVEAIHGKGLVNDRHFRENNEKKMPDYTNRNRKYQSLQ